MIILNRLSYLRGTILILSAFLCLACPGYAADPPTWDVTLQWDKSIDDPYLIEYRFYYYSIPGVPQSLGDGYKPYAEAATYIKEGETVPARHSITPGGPKSIVLKKISTASQTQITLHFEDNNIKEYYFAVTSVDGRGLEGLPTTPEVFPPLRRLTVQKEGLGRGTVAGSPAGINRTINCGVGSDCLADFAATKKVILSATEDAGHTFTGWISGCDSIHPVTRECTVTMGAAKTVKAHFIPTPKGDINKDTLVNLADAILILQVMSKRGTLPPESYLADANRDGKLGLADTIFILQKAAGLR